MSHHLKRILETLTAKIGINNTLATLMTGAACLGGLAGGAAIKTGKTLNPHQPLLQTVILYSSGLSMPLMSATGTGVIAISVIAKRIRITQEESRQLEQEARKHCPQPSPCKGCKHFHGIIYNSVQIVCAMHPYGIEGEQCPDWEGDLPSSANTYNS